MDVLVNAEVTEPRTLINLVDLNAAFDNSLRRPRGAVSGIQTSPGLVAYDWITDSGTRGTGTTLNWNPCSLGLRLVFWLIVSWSKSS
ncbi:MAG: hypothetical protein OXC98_02375 [bacterium]|nr:hypothetical protein [bacterium]